MSGTPLTLRRHVYVIVGEAGGWELRETWVVGVRAHREGAERWVAEATPLASEIAAQDDWPSRRAAIQMLIECDPVHRHADLLNVFGRDAPLLPYQLEIFASTEYRIEAHELL